MWKLEAALRSGRAKPSEKLGVAFQSVAKLFCLFRRLIDHGPPIDDIDKAARDRLADMFLGNVVSVFLKE